MYGSTQRTVEFHGTWILERNRRRGEKIVCRSNSIDNVFAGHDEINKQTKCHHHRCGDDVLLHRGCVPRGNGTPKQRGRVAPLTFSAAAAHERMQPQDEAQESEGDARERMAQLMGRAKIGLADVEVRLGLQGTVVAAYVSGSRLWGTATDASDFDILVVAKQREPHRTLHWGSVDALVYSPEEWQVRILCAAKILSLYSICLLLRMSPLDVRLNRSQKQRDAHYVSALVCAFLTGPWVWKAPPVSMFRPLTIDRPRLRQSVVEETDRDWQFAGKCFAKGQVERAQKTLSHALRLCLVAVQIAEHGRPTRIHSLYSHPSLALPYAAYTLEDAEAAVRPELDRLRALL